MFPLLEPHWRLSGSTEADRSPCDTFLWVTYSTSFRHVLHVDRIIGLLVCFDALCSQTLDYFVGSFFFHPSSPLFFHFYNPLTLDRGEKRIEGVALSLNCFLLIGGIEFLWACLIFTIRVSNFFLFPLCT